MQDKNIASTFAKGMAVLAAFDGGHETLSLAELARATGQDRATARRGVLTLVQLGYLHQDDRRFRLTPKVLSLAGGFLQANGFGRQVQPVLNYHAAMLGAEITLALRDGDDVLLLAQSTVQDGPVSYGFTLGSRLPLLHTSLGRMLLACEAEPAMQEIVARAPLPRHTERALDDRGAIAEAIGTARTGGACVTDGEFETGIAGLAVPVSRPGERGAVVGASFPSGSGPHDARLQRLHICAADLRKNHALDKL
jgi:IclR family pca regulon transcriptional regulator